MSVNEKMTAIADNIRQYTGSTEKLNLDQMAEAVHDVFTVGDLYGYGVGYEDGHTEGVEQGVEEGYWRGYTAGANAGYDRGKQEQYDAFWDAYQQNGNRTVYSYAFSGYGFNADTFYPKYDIIPSGYNQSVFYGWSGSKVRLNLKQRLEECGVKLDTSKATFMGSMFGYGTFSVIPEIDCTGITTDSSSVFYEAWSHLQKIEKIITKETVKYAAWFRNDIALKEITFEGVIGQDIDFSSCPLTKASIENIIEHLSATSSGKTLTLKQTAVNDAFTTAEFEALKATRANWTFSLV